LGDWNAPPVPVRDIPTMNNPIPGPARADERIRAVILDGSRAEIRFRISISSA
jgi:hypothetical protein